MCFGGGGGGTTTAGSTTFTPPAATQPGWQDLISGAEQYASQPYQQYQGMTVAPINGTQLQGMDFLQDNALNGSPDLNAARGAMTNISNGAYMNNDPWLSNGATQAVINSNAQAMGNAAAIGQNAQTDAQFAQGGAYGGSAYQQAQAQNALALNTAVGNMANQYQSQLTGLGAQDYSNGVNQMINAANATGPLAATDQTAGKNLVAIGDAEQQNMQNQLNASSQAFQQQQQYPMQMAQFLQQVLTGASGGFTQPTSSSTQGYQINPISALLGGATAATGLLG